MIAFAAGLFIYLGAVDFLTKSTKDMPKKKALTVLLLGVLSMIIVLNVIPHSHETHEEHTHEEAAQEEYL